MDGGARGRGGPECVRTESVVAVRPIFLQHDVSHMATAANGDRATATDGNSARQGNGDSATQNDGGSKSMADRLETVATVVWLAFLGFVVVLALIPVVGVLAGVAPFTPPDTTPYFAFVGLAVVGTVALIGAAIWDV